MDFELNLTTESIDHARIDSPLAVGPRTTLREVLVRLKERGDGSILVVDGAGRLIGIFTERDALSLLVDDCDLDTPIEHVMVKNPDTVKNTDTVATVIRRMSERRHRRIPVVDEQGRPTGIVKTSGIVHYLVDHFPQTVYNLPPNSNQAPEQREGA